MNPKEIIRKYRENKDPMSINWRALAMEVATEIISAKFAEMEKAVRFDFNELIEELTKDLTPQNLKGEKGNPGPRGFPGKFVVGKPGPIGKPGPAGPKPTRQEIMDLLEPMVAKIKDGETPSDSRLLKLFKPYIPTKEKLLGLIKPLINAFEEKFDKKLSEFMADVRRLLRERKGGGGASSGGGMGNIITQSTAISSATTTISLDYNVASDGKAIWFNYQGQQQAYGTHFTVSGKTITLLFTPSDSTFADIIYIRR